MIKLLNKLKTKNKYVYMRFKTLKSKKSINFLLKENLVFWVTKVKATKCYKFSVNNSNNSFDIENYRQSSKVVIMPIKKLKKIMIKEPKSLYILQTNKGLISSRDAIKYNVGGLLIAKIK